MFLALLIIDIGSFNWSAKNLEPILTSKSFWSSTNKLAASAELKSTVLSCDNTFLAALSTLLLSCWAMYAAIGTPDSGLYVSTNLATPSGPYLNSLAKTSTSPSYRLNLGTELSFFIATLLIVPSWVSTMLSTASTPFSSYSFWALSANSMLFTIGDVNIANCSFCKSWIFSNAIALTSVGWSGSLTISW